MIDRIRNNELGIIIMFFFCSAVVTMLMSVGFVRFSGEGAGVLPGGSDANREYAVLLPMMITGYYAGAIGALARYGIDREKLLHTNADVLGKLKVSAVFRLLVGGLFGVVAYLVMQSNLLVTLLFDTSKAVGAEVPTVPVSVAGVLIVGFFVGVFSSEVFGSLKARFDQDEENK